MTVSLALDCQIKICGVGCVMLVVAIERDPHEGGLPGVHLVLLGTYFLPEHRTARTKGRDLNRGGSNKQ